MIQLLINHCKVPYSNPEGGAVKTTKRQLRDWLSKAKMQDKGFQDKASRYQEVKEFLIQECSQVEGESRCCWLFIEDFKDFIILFQKLKKPFR